MFLNHGLKDVLPPFESFKGCSSNLVNYSPNGHDIKELAHELCKAELVQQEHVEQNQQNIKNEFHLLMSQYGEGNQLPNCNVSVNFSEPIHVHKSLPSLVSSRVMKDKRKRRKGRCKKRSMVDILAVARHCYTDQTVTEAYQNKNISN
jgi:hypothetical protein